jgi:uncharacterized protein (DUF1697 family)
MSTRTTYIALLRGINIGGHRVKMERLRALFGELGFSNVSSYIQTGNVFFATTETDRQVLCTRIEEHLHQALGYEVPVLLRTVPELEQALHPNPYETIEGTPDTRLLIVFTSEPVICNESLPVRSADGSVEIVQITPGEVFVVYRLVNGRPANVEAFMKRVLDGQGKTTTRFYGTSLKILEAAKSNEHNESRG